MRNLFEDSTTIDPLDEASCSHFPTNILPTSKSNLAKGRLDIEHGLEDEVEIIEKTVPDQLPFPALLPGMMYQPDNCQVARAIYCNHCGHSFWVMASCNERGCPVCYERWSWLEAGRASRRIWTKLADLRKQGVYARVHHIVVSVRYHGQEYDALKKQARKVCRQQGVDGDLMVYHQWRESEGRWTFDGTVHFHVLGISTGFLKFGDVQDDDVLFKVLPNKGTPDRPWGGIPTLVELRRVISYQLSHCAVMESKHGVVWSGCLAYTKWSQADVDRYGGPPRRAVCCPNCQSFDTERCAPGWARVDDDVHVGWGMSEGHPWPDTEPPKGRRVVIKWVNPLRSERASSDAWSEVAR